MRGEYRTKGKSAKCIRAAEELDKLALSGSCYMVCGIHRELRVPRDSEEGAVWKQSVRFKSCPPSDP